MKTKITLIAIILGIISYSCESDKLELDGNYIEIKQSADSFNNKEVLINFDTIHSSLNDEYSLNIYTQSQPNFKSIILKRINENALVDITDIPGEATLKGFFEEKGVQRKINEIKVSLNDNIYNSGQTITYIVKIKSSSEAFEKELTIKIK